MSSSSEETTVRKYKLNEKSYTKAINTIAKQLIAMAQEDAEPDETEEEFWWRVDEYTGDVGVQISEALDDIVAGE
jgi:hypothetical protein